MTTTHLIDCPKPGCGYSAEGSTRRQAASRMLRHLSRDDHAPHFATVFARREADVERAAEAFSHRIDRQPDATPADAERHPDCLPTVPGYLEGIVSLNPPTVQCGGCARVVHDRSLALAVLIPGFRFNSVRYAAGTDTRRLCPSCAAAAWPVTEL